MSSKRPGTVDYSHFENIDYSSAEDEKEPDHAMENRRRQYAHWQSTQDEKELSSDDRSAENSSDDESNQDEIEGEQQSGGKSSRNKEAEQVTVPKVSATQNLSMLQQAWGTSVATTNDNGADAAAAEDAAPSAKKMKSCVACHKEDPHFKCSRCQIVWYCDKKCQVAYHPIHRQECIDVSEHYAYWGIFNSKSGNETDVQARKDKLVELKSVLESRMASRRRRALKRATAQAAIERARRAREAAGHGKGGGKEKQKTKEETCSICQCEFTFENLEAAGSLCCPGSHYMCAECTGVYVNSVVSDLETSYPPKCSLCRALFDMQHFERQLTASQQLTAQVHAAKEKLKPGQELIQCDTCSSLDTVWTIELNNKESTVLWWCQECSSGKCLVCLKKLPLYGQDKYRLHFHNVCGELREAKSVIEKALENGSKRACPGCGLSGLKDDACTHMTCPKCATGWCYVCGLDVVNCDKALPRSEDADEDDIFLHNQDWEVNENRCPMYLTQILEVDLGWMGADWEANATNEDFEDDARCLEYFHRFQTIKKLQEVRDLIGPKDYSRAFETFESIKNAGYSLDEIIETDTTVLIDREEYRLFRAEHPEEEEEHGMEDEDESSESDSENEEEQLLESIERSLTSEAEDQKLRDAIEQSLTANEATEQEPKESLDSESEENQRMDEDGYPLDSEEEEEQIDEAIERSRASEAEDQQMRDTIERSQASEREDDGIRMAIERSRASEEEDQQMRDAINLSIADFSGN